jgi:hypothetical protein
MAKHPGGSSKPLSAQTLLEMQVGRKALLRHRMNTELSAFDDAMASKFGPQARGRASATAVCGADGEWMVTVMLDKNNIAYEPWKGFPSDLLMTKLALVLG